MSNQVFKVVLLQALPASGKSEVRNFMAHVEERFKSKENNKKFTTEFTIVTNSHKKIRIRINAEYVGDTNVNVSYVLKTELVNEE